ALAADGRPARFVGGCVRDALLTPGADVADLDVATPERPERVMKLLRAAGIRAIPTGLQHGTVTALLDGHRYEITTLRRDVACFGRHAEVEFTDDYAADAARRDFTINAMSCDGDGRLHDPVGGLADLRAGLVRFVGDPRQRIVEDYLRILRFFRFFARFGRAPADAASLAACGELASGVDRLSGERVRHELLGILAAERPLMALALMRPSGVMARVLPGPVALEALERLLEAWPDADPLLRLAALLRDGGDDRIEPLTVRLKLSNAQTERLTQLLATPLPDLAAPLEQQRLAIYRLGAAPVRDLVRLAVAGGKGDPAAAVPWLRLAESWAAPGFPLTGADVLARGLQPGPEVGRLLDAVRNWWEGLDFQPDRGACLARLDRLLCVHTIGPPSVDSPSRPD
ncbi:MAG: CCA tRNA nucleotidyltransferase, partial [Geminicoccaceae bacterium]